jgi:O-antigen/teichoic acid export membrane protein
VVYFKFGILGVFQAQLIALSISTLLVTYYNRKNFVLRINTLLVRRMFSYSLPQFPARIGSMSLGQANRFFMLSFLSIQAIGIYSVSLKLASVIQLINTAFIMAWAPFMHKLFKKDNNKLVFASIMPLVCAFTFLFVSLITLYSVEMIKLIASPEYFEAHHYIGGLSLFFALYIIKEVVDIGPKITEQTKYISYNFFISVIINVISLYFFIDILKLPGVIIAMILTNLCLVLISWYTSNKLYYISFNKFRFILSISPVILICFFSLFYSLDLNIRIGLSIIYLIYYCILSLKSYREFKLVV